MAYTAPTVDDFLLRFPDLSDTEDDVVQRLLDEAMRYVDDSWLERDYQDAVLYLAAHWTSKEKAAESSGEIASESFGPISVTYARSTDPESLSSTQYGRRFSELRRGNFPAIVVI
jgi:hypothetical protein